MQPDPSNTAPLGWSYNPSTRAHRFRLLPFAGTGFLIVLYLMLCQIGVFQSAWDPFFNDGTNQVLHSTLSRALPIPDALLGAFVYLLEVALLIAGPDDRWLRKPLLTTLSRLMGLSLGAASLGLMFLQPVVVHTWCTWCLISVVLILILLQRSVAELLACVQTWILISRYGGHSWRWLWHGADTRTSNLFAFQLERRSMFLWTEGTHCVWTLFASFLLGSITLALPDLFGIEGIGKGTLEFCGAVTVAISLLSMSEPLRFLRWANGAMGSLLFFWFLGQPVGADRWISAVLGLAIIVFCLHRGKVAGTYGFFSSPPEIQRRLDRMLLEHPI